MRLCSTVLQSGFGNPACDATIGHCRSMTANFGSMGLGGWVADGKGYGPMATTAPPNRPPMAAPGTRTHQAIKVLNPRAGVQFTTGNKKD